MKIFNYSVGNQQAVSECRFTQEFFYGSSSDCPRKMEASLNVSKMENDSASPMALKFVLQRSIDGVTWYDEVTLNDGEYFQDVTCDGENDILNKSQIIKLFDNTHFLGARCRLKWFMDESVSSNSFNYDFSVAILVK